MQVHAQATIVITPDNPEHLIPVFNIISGRSVNGEIVELDSQANTVTIRQDVVEDVS